MQVTRRHFCGLTCSTLALGATGCAVNPATGESGLMLVSSDQERRIGAEEHPKIIKEFGGVYDDPRVAGYAASIGGRLAQVTEQPDTSYTFTVLDNPIVNAFALPGGYVYITRGLMALAENEAELAGVLGHEIGHVVARHSSQRRSTAILAQIGAGLLGAATGSSAIGNLAATGAGVYLRSFSRDQELEADRLGVRYL
ncbi:MAG TPA: peptidase, partial [Alphaproteobacteria bacterium]|nr:peptidase [Alphaproteobacteria bacterium]